jgi:hypothetical protein
MLLVIFPVGILKAMLTTFPQMVQSLCRLANCERILLKTG